MAKGSSNTRGGSNGSRSASSSSVASTFNNAEAIKTYGAKETKEALMRTNDLIKAIASNGGLVGEGWKVQSELINRNTAFELLGKDGERAEVKEVINNLKIDRRSASLTNEGDIISDGTSLYSVAKINKDGSVRAIRTTYDSRTRGNGVVQVVPITDRIKINKDDIVTSFGRGGAALRFQQLYDDHIYSLRKKK